MMGISAARRRAREAAILALALAGCSSLLDYPTHEAAECEPGDEDPCYTGPAGTLDVGACRAGVRVCKPDGSGYGACTGEVTPREQEICSTPEDDDCNGSAFDEDKDGCTCAPGASRGCESDAAGACRPGTQRCEDSGEAFGPCVSDVAPALERCETAADESCDGKGECTGENVWTRRHGGTQAAEPAANSIEQAHDLAVDGDGNVIVVGRFTGTFGLAGCDGPPPDDDATYEGFVAKFDPGGEPLWCHAFSGPGHQSAIRVAVDASNNVIVAGYTNNAMDLDGETVGLANIVSVFIAKMTPGGDFMAHTWLHDDKNPVGIGSVPGGFGFTPNWDVALSAHGEGVLVAGSYKGSPSFSDDLYIPETPRAGEDNSLDTFVLSLDTDLNRVWGYSAHGKGHQSPFAVAMDRDGNVYLGGRYGSANGTDPGGISLSGCPDPDEEHTYTAGAFLAKLNAGDRMCLWRIDYGTKEPSANGGAIRSIATDSRGDVVVAGEFLKHAELAGHPLDAGYAAAGTPDVFLAKLTSPPEDRRRVKLLWSHVYGDAGNQFASKIAVDGGDNVLFAGILSGSVQFGAYCGALPASNNARAVFLKLDPRGSCLWSRFAPASGTQHGLGIGADPAGNVFATGMFTAELDLGGEKAVSSGNQDVFLARLAP